MNDCWGDLSEIGDVRTPATILREQAMLLTQKTDGLVEGRVWLLSTQAVFELELRMIVPLLDWYPYSLLTVSYPSNLYPATLRVSAIQELAEPRVCTDEAQFLQELGQILSHPAVKKVIVSLVAQAREIRRGQYERREPNK